MLSLRSLQQRKFIIPALIFLVILVFLFSYKNDLSEKASIPPLYPDLQWVRGEGSFMGEGTLKTKKFNQTEYKATLVDPTKKQIAESVKQYYQTRLMQLGWKEYPTIHVNEEDVYTYEYVKSEFPFLCPEHLVQNMFPCIGGIRFFTLIYSGREGFEPNIEIYYSQGI